MAEFFIIHVQHLECVVWYGHKVTMGYGWTSLNFRDNKTISRDRVIWLLVRTGKKALCRACRGMDICQSSELSPLFFHEHFFRSRSALTRSFRLYDTHTPGEPLAPLPSFLTSSLPPVTRHATIRSSCKASLWTYEKPAGDRRLRLDKTNFALLRLYNN